MAIEFVVEHIIQVKGHKPYIIVRHLMPGQTISILKKAFLNGIEIHPSLTRPRASYENGTHRLDLYSFSPIYSNDIRRFEKNTIVVLTTEE